MIKEKELMAWASKTADAYHTLATDPVHPKCNLAFYTQSDLRKLTTPPELLILTINPNRHPARPPWRGGSLRQETGPLYDLGGKFFSLRRQKLCFFGGGKAGKIGLQERAGRLPHKMKP